MPSASATFIELARRRQIVEAAIATISELGLSRSSIAAIAERADVSPALISYHFGSRRGLIDAVLESIQADVDTAMESDGEDDSYPAALEGMLRRFVRHCLANLPAMLTLTRFRQGDGGGADRRDESREKGLTELVSFIAEGQRHGQFRPLDAPLFAAFLLNAMTDLPLEISRRGVDDRAVFEREWPAMFVRAIASDGRNTIGE